MRQDIREENTVDLLLMLDCTSSMDPWIEASKNKLAQLVDKLRE
jgi:uncharacterized protein with von Willebrand factor type A (vWA) domain